MSIILHFLQQTKSVTDVTHWFVIIYATLKSLKIGFNYNYESNLN